ncbi:nuclear transport factor 2 family protein [Microbacterium lacus]|uniref:nuclear transport factor 2 family protein n=1 Tax=Microbacterium lacus TaxID=415217 RepID=UPI00384FE47F
MTSLSYRTPSLDDLASVEEIKQLKARYCYYVDHQDWPRWASLFAPDAQVDLSAFSIARDPVTNERIPVPGFTFEFLEGLSAYEWPLIGRAAVQGFGESRGSLNRRSVHHVFTPEIELSSQSTARAVWPMEDYGWWPEGSKVVYMHGMGYYRETYERLDDQRWYIKTSVVSRSWIEWRR